MKKVFLCHASEDKEYVRILANKLTRAKVIFDEMSFNAGEDFREEIIRSLDETAIFVFVASKKSISKIWCHFEINNAELKIMRGDISKQLTLQIDYNMSFDELPQWMQKTKVVFQSRPSQAIREIQQLLFQILPNNFKKPLVGRLQEMDNLSKRMITTSSHVFITYGLDGIGRRSFLDRFVQDNLSLHLGPFFVIDKNYTIDELYPLLLEETADIGSIENFAEEIKLFRSLSNENKEKEIIRCLKLLCKDKNLPCFIDHGGLLLETGQYACYIEKIIKYFETNEDDFYCAIIHTRKSCYCPQNPNNIATTQIQPLPQLETKLLLKQLFSSAEIKTSEEQLNRFVESISGYPPAAYFVLNYVKEYGVDVAYNSISDILDFNVKNFTPYLNAISLCEQEKIILKYMAGESAMPLEAIAIATNVSIDECATIVKKMIDLCIITQYDGIYTLSAPIRNSITRLLGLFDENLYKDIANRLSAQYWSNKNIAPSILVIDATLHATVMANRPIEEFNDFISASTLLRFALDFYKQRKWGDSFMYAERALTLAPSRIEIKRIQIKSLIQLERWNDAENKLKTIETDKEFFYLKGFLLKKRRYYSEAKKAFESALETGDRAHSVYRDYAEVLYRLGHYNEAEENLNIVLARDNGNIYVLDTLIRIYIDKKEFDKAKNKLGVLEKNDIDEKFIHHRKASFYLAMNHFSEALQEAEYACDKQEGLFEANGQKANILIEMGRYSEAKTCLDFIQTRFGGLKLNIQYGIKCKFFIKQKKWREAESIWNRLSEKDKLSNVNLSLLLSILRIKIQDDDISLSEKIVTEKKINELVDQLQTSDCLGFDLFLLD